MTRWLIVSLTLTGLALATALAVCWVWSDALQERIPIHWDINMQPDGWVVREHFLPYLLIFPGLMALLVLLMWGLPLISPKNFEVERFASTWGYVFTLIISCSATCALCKSGRRPWRMRRNTSGSAGSSSRAFS